MLRQYSIDHKSSSSTAPELFNQEKSAVPEPFHGKKHSHGISIGVPRAELTNQWWTVFTAIPADQNPLNPSNEGVIDDICQPGKVHFLGGTFGASDLTIRDVTVTNDQSIVLPILTTGADNVGWDFSLLPGYEQSPVPYQFSIRDLRILNEAIMDTAEGVSLEVNDTLLVSDTNKDQYRQTSRNPYTLNLPSKDDILGYNALYPEEWIKFPYTKGVQDGFWVELKNLPLGENTIHFEGTVDYKDIVVEDYNHSGGIGDTPLEWLLGYLRDNNPSSSFDVTYNVDVLSRSTFNAQMGV